MALRMSAATRDKLRAEAVHAVALHGPLNDVDPVELEDVMVDCLNGQLTIGDMVAVYRYRRGARHG